MRTKYYHTPAGQVRIGYFIADANGKFINDIPIQRSNLVRELPRITICSILDGNKLSFGYTTCSQKDRYIKKVGNKIAYDRALNNPCFVREMSEEENIHEISANIVDAIYEAELTRMTR